MPTKSHLEAYVSKQDFPIFGIFASACSPGLGLLGFPRLGSASLALPAPRNNSPAAFGGRAARSAAAVVAGAGKASEADPRRGKPSKPRPGEKADPHNDDEVATKLSRPCDDLATRSISDRFWVDFGSIIGPKGKGPQTNGPKLGRAPNIGPERGPRPGPGRGAQTNRPK